MIIKWDKSNDLSISIKDSLNLKVACLYVEIYLKKKRTYMGCFRNIPPKIGFKR